MVVGCEIGCDHGQMWWNAVQCCVKCGVMQDVCIMWPIYGVILNVAWSTWNVACEMGCNARCGVMHNVADTWGD